MLVEGKNGKAPLWIPTSFMRAGESIGRWRARRHVRSFAQEVPQIDTSARMRPCEFDLCARNCDRDLACLLTNGDGRGRPFRRQEITHRIHRRERLTVREIRISR